VVSIDELFAIDAGARARNLDHAARHALRWEPARPLLDIIRQRIETAHADALPSSALGRAASYTLAVWQKLTRFLEYPELEWSNHVAENCMRPAAPGRKNWIRLGSPQAGPASAPVNRVVGPTHTVYLPE
jgi:hypothetical protein